MRNGSINQLPESVGLAFTDKEEDQLIAEARVQGECERGGRGAGPQPSQGTSTGGVVLDALIGICGRQGLQRSAKGIQAQSCRRESGVAGGDLILEQGDGVLGFGLELDLEGFGAQSPAQDCGQMLVGGRDGGLWMGVMVELLAKGRGEGA